MNKIRNTRDFIITSHVRKRFCERILKMPEANVEEFLKNNQSKSLVNKTILECIKEMEEEKSYLNNTSFMQILHEKYGNEGRFQVFVYKQMNVLFISEMKMSSKKTRNILKTCYALDSGYMLIRCLNLHDKPVAKVGQKKNRITSTWRKRKSKKFLKKRK